MQQAGQATKQIIGCYSIPEQGVAQGTNTESETRVQETEKGSFYIRFIFVLLPVKPQPEHSSTTTHFTYHMASVSGLQNILFIEGESKSQLRFSRVQGRWVCLTSPAFVDIRKGYG